MAAKAKKTKEANNGYTNVEEVLAAVASGEITASEGQKALKDINTARRQKPLYCKVSEKGAVSVYGLMRFPVTLYLTQWERLLGFVPEIAQFLKDHKSELSTKD